jgi:hypothetical protein
VTTTETILARIRALQDQMEEEFARRRAAFRYRFENGRVVFEAEARRRHREMRVRLSTFLRHARLLNILTAPVIYSMIVPFALLDLFVTIYQAICFPASTAITSPISTRCKGSIASIAAIATG